MSFHSTKKTSKKKKVASKKQDLTPAQLQRRLRQISEGEVRSTMLVKEPKGTLEAIGHEADQAWSGVKKIMALLNTEMKHVYYNSTNNSVTQAGTVLDLCSLISQGVGGAQRVGDSIKLKRVRVKMNYSFNAALTTNQVATIVIGQSKDGVPLVADVFAVLGATTSGMAFPLDTFDKADRWSRHHTVSADTYRPQHQLEFDVPYSHDVLFTNGTTTTSSGNVWLAFISNEPTNYPNLAIAIDIAFLDN